VPPNQKRLEGIVSRGLTRRARELLHRPRRALSAISTRPLNHGQPLVPVAPLVHVAPVALERSAPRRHDDDAVVVFGFEVTRGPGLSLLGGPESIARASSVADEKTIRPLSLAGVFRCFPAFGTSAAETSWDPRWPFTRLLSFAHSRS
jgi:hypothetical protein